MHKADKTKMQHAETLSSFEPNDRHIQSMHDTMLVHRINCGKMLIGQNRRQTIYAYSVLDNRLNFSYASQSNLHKIRSKSYFVEESSGLSTHNSTSTIHLLHQDECSLKTIDHPLPVRLAYDTTR